MALTPAKGRNDAALMVPAHAMPEHAFTAGGAGDGAEQTAATLDLRDGFDTKRFASLTAVVSALAVLAATKTLVVTGIFEHSADGATWAEIGTDVDLLTLTGAAGGSTETGAAVLGCNLTEAERYVRFKVKGDLSAANTDTAKLGVSYVLTNPSKI